MKFGLFMVPTASAMNPRSFGELAEECGFESVFLPQHTHIPTGQDTEYPFGGEVPDEYRQVFDPLVTLSWIASSTTTLRIGTGVCLVLQNDLITLAKAVATLDQLSQGRMLFGVGAGWNIPEMASHGIDPRTRSSELVERVEALKVIWRDSEAQYRGKFVDFAPMWSWPKPVQRPHPPILLGGNHRNTLQRAMALDADWMPNVALLSDKGLTKGIAELAAARGDGGARVSAFRAKPDIDEIEHYAQIGIERCIFAVPSGSESETIDLVRSWAKAAHIVS